METIEKAKQEYTAANAEGKALLAKIFGKENFISSDNWMQQWIKFSQDHKLKLVLPYPNPSNPDEEYIDAQFMMMHIIRIKRSHKPDFNNSNETKYNPIFDMRTSSGFGFSISSYGYWDSISIVGSRLCMPDDRKLIEQLAVEFQPIYEKIMIEP